MSVADKLKAQGEIQEAIIRFYTAKKALDLALRNNSSGLYPMTPNLKLQFRITYLNLKEEYEGLLDRYVTASNSVSALVSSKLLDIYGKIIANLRALGYSNSSGNYNYFKRYKEYSFPKAQAEEIADLNLVSEEFIEDVRATRDISTSFADEENFG